MLSRRMLRLSSQRKPYFEDGEQQALFDWAALYPQLVWMHAIPNGGKRDQKEATRLKRQGVKAGVSDIFLPMVTDKYPGLYIEMKRTKKQGASKVSDSQKAFLKYAKNQGYRCEICYGANEAIQVIKEYAKL